MQLGTKSHCMMKYNALATASTNPAEFRMSTPSYKNCPSNSQSQVVTAVLAGLVACPCCRTQLVLPSLLQRYWK